MSIYANVAGRYLVENDVVVAVLVRSLGDLFIHVDLLVENNRSLPELLPPEPDEVEIKIGKHIAELIEDGSTM
ncbi:MAG: hypothetical protein ACOC5A_00360 [Halanaerobiales bacterium]